MYGRAVQAKAGTTGAQYSGVAKGMGQATAAAGWLCSHTHRFRPRSRLLRERGAGLPQRALSRSASVSGLLASRTRCGYFRPPW
jgi:hypothetical protein